MFSGFTQPSGALGLLRFVNLSSLGRQGLPVMKTMLRNESFNFFLKGSCYYFFNLGDYISRGMLLFFPFCHSLYYEL